MKKDSSSSDSSDDSDDEPAKKKPALAKTPVTNGKSTANGKSSSEDSSDSDDDETAKKPKVAANKSITTAKKEESSSSDSSDSDKNTSKLAKTPAKTISPTKTSTPNNFKPVKFVSGGFAKPTVPKPESSSDDSSEDEDQTVQNKSIAGKKRKLSENGDSPMAKKANNTKNNSFNKSANGNGNSKPNTPFRRVKTEDVEVDERLANNSFDAKVILSPVSLKFRG